MASAQTPAKWQPNGKSSGRNSGTKGSVNDRDCASCGAVRKHHQKTHTPPPQVFCPECWRDDDSLRNKKLRMHCNKEDREDVARLIREGAAKGRATQTARVVDDVAAKLEDKPRPTQSEIDAEYDKLWGQIKGGRPAAGELFWRQLCGLVCLCNCAICLLAVLYSPTVFMVFCYLWGCIPAKKDDVVAIPADYIAWGVAVVTLVDQRYPGQRYPWAFCGYRGLQRSEMNFPKYDGYSGGFDSKYDEEDPVDDLRISLCAGNGEDPLMPGAMYDEKRDWLGVYKSKSAGTGGVAVINIPLLIKDGPRGRYRKTVVAAKVRRRQIVMAFLFTSVLAALSWVPLARDFAVLKGRAEDPATIGVQISN